MAQAVSRLAMNGFLKYAQEITFPVNPKFKDDRVRQAYLGL